MKALPPVAEGTKPGSGNYPSNPCFRSGAQAALTLSTEQPTPGLRDPTGTLESGPGAERATVRREVVRAVKLDPVEERPPAGSLGFHLGACTCTLTTACRGPRTF